VIDSYSFGEIVVDGTKYTQDIIVFPDRVDDSWWREEGHAVSVKDIESIVEEKPDVLIVGTGYYGLVKVGAEVKNYLRRLGIRLVVKRTERACQIFNELSSSMRVIAALHLTC